MEAMGVEVVGLKGVLSDDIRGSRYRQEVVDA